MAGFGHGDGQVGRDRALADTALAGGDSDDVLDARHQLDAELHGVGNDFCIEVGRGVANSRQRAHGGDHLLADGVDLGFGRVAELDVEGDVVAIDLDILQRLAGDVILAGIGVDRSSEGGLDLLFCKTHGNSG